jgi:hypothetical protein
MEEDEGKGRKEDKGMRKEGRRGGRRKEGHIFIWRGFHFWVGI